MAMTENDLRDLTPKLPTREEILRAPMQARYDRETDTLMIYWSQPGRPAVSVPLGDHVFLRTDPETRETYGVQIEDFLSHVVYDNPELLIIAPLVGMKPREVARIARRLSPEQRVRLNELNEQRERLAAASVIGQFIPTIMRPAM